MQEYVHCLTMFKAAPKLPSVPVLLWFGLLFTLFFGYSEQLYHYESQLFTSLTVLLHLHSLYMNTCQRCTECSGKGKEELNHLFMLPCCSFPPQAFCALLRELWAASLLSVIRAAGLQLLATFALFLTYVQNKALMLPHCPTNYS